MTVRNYAENKYLIDFRDSNGNRVRKVVFATKSQAKQIEIKMRREWEEELLNPQKHVTYGVLTDMYWKLHASQSTSRSAHAMWQRMKELFGHIPMKELTSLKLQEEYNKMLETCKASTCNRYFTIVGASINYGISNGLWNGNNPWKAVKKKPAENAREKYWSIEDFNKFFEGCRPIVRQVVELAAHSGMRLGELFNLDWQDIDFERGIIQILKSKTSKRRNLPMSRDLRSALMSFAPKLSGKVIPMSLSAFSCAFTRHRDKKGLKHLTFHDLRHTFASAYRMVDGNLGNLQALLGHADLRMTNRYAHLSPDYIAQAIQCMNGNPLLPKVDSGNIAHVQNI